MAKQGSFLLRIDPKIMEALKKWADDDLRSVNGQVEYVLRAALIKAGRYSKPTEEKNTAINKDDSNSGE